MFNKNVQHATAITILLLVTKYVETLTVMTKDIRQPIRLLIKKHVGTAFWHSLFIRKSRQVM